MPYQEILHPLPDLQILIWHLTEEVQDLLMMYGKGCLPEAYRPNMSDKRKKEILAEALLLRGYFRKDKELHHCADGSPFIDGCYVSVSHTNPYVAIALHPTRRIGIDIECLGAKAVRVARRFLHPDEIYAISKVRRMEAVHICWSVKEALYKLYSIEGVDFAEDIHLAPFEVLPQGSVRAILSYVPDVEFEVGYQLYRGCSLAYVVDP